MKNSAGFTLVELIVTITLVGMLVSSLIPTFNSLTNRTNRVGRVVYGLLGRD